MNEHTFRVEGMSCGHCEQAIRSEVGELVGLEVREISSATGVLVVAGEQIDDQQVIAAVDEAGYTAVRA